MFRTKTTGLVGALSLTCVLTACSESDAEGSDEPIPVVFQSKWFPQAQFAGYYAAGGLPADGDGNIEDELAGTVPLDEDGLTYYEAEGLEVAIIPGAYEGEFFNPTQQVSEGPADFGTDWIANVVRNIEENDYSLRHIAQVYQQSGYELVAPASTGIGSLEDFGQPSPDGDAVKVGIWPAGNQFPAIVCMRQAGLLTDLETQGTAQEGQENVDTVEYAFDPALVFPDPSNPDQTVCEAGGGTECAEVVDVASAMVYNELNQIVGLGHSLDQVVRIRASEAGCGLLEDFIFTTAELLDEEDFKGSGVSGREVAERFVRGSLRGWQWTLDNEAEATSLVLDYCGDTCAGSGSTASPEVHQQWQMAEVNKLVRPTPETTVGCLDFAAFEATIERLTSINFVREGTGREIVDSEVLARAGVLCP